MPRRWLAAAAILTVTGVLSGVALWNRDNATPVSTNEPPSTTVQPAAATTTAVPGTTTTAVAAPFVFESPLGYQIEFPAGWSQVDADGDGLIDETFEAPDGGSVRADAIDQANRVPFFDAVPDPLPTLAETAADLAANFPYEFGRSPRIATGRIDGREAQIIRPSQDAAATDVVTYLAPLDPDVPARFLELRLDSAHAEQIIASFRWFDVVRDVRCPDAPPGPGEVWSIGDGMTGTADLDGDGSLDRLVAWEEDGQILMQAYLADGASRTAAVTMIGIPDYLARADLDGDGGEEVFVTGPGNTARNALILTLDGCELRVVADQTGLPFLALVGAGGNSCSPTGCRPSVECVANAAGGYDLLATMIGPADRGSTAQASPDLAMIWETSLFRLDDDAMHQTDAPDVTVALGDLPAGWNEYEDAIDCPTPAPTADDRTMADELVAWATDPGTPFPLPLSGEVVLGLGSNAVRTATAADLADPAGWTLDVEEYGGFAGPFSALDALASAQRTAVSVGPHPHCAGVPIPEPAPLFDLRRLSIRPTFIDSCIDWFAVDVFLDGTGRVRGVTLALFGP